MLAVRARTETGIVASVTAGPPSGQRDDDGDKTGKQTKAEEYHQYEHERGCHVKASLR